MIILDTNVVSELLKRDPDPSVVRWLDSLPAGNVATSAITAAELVYGIERLPAGRRKARIAKAISALLHEDVENRIVAFELESAERYGLIVANRERSGRPIALADAQIAAICAQRRAALATRNVRDFEETGIELINPWDIKRTNS